MNLFFSIIQILRPLNIILCLITVLIATFLLDEFQSPVLFYTLIVVCCFAGASNILNDASVMFTITTMSAIITNIQQEKNFNK